MAYFNFILLDKKGYSIEDVVYLQLIKQNRTEPLVTYIEKIGENKLNEYEEEGLIIYIKGDAKESKLEKVRLSKKGIDFLDLIETPEVDEDDMKLLSWLVNVYKSEDKMIGNKKRIAAGIASFKKNTGIERNNLAFLLKSFIGDEKNFEYSQKLENLFYNNKNVFQRKFILDDCRLYDYYQKHKDFFNSNFK